ncbi:N-acetylmuramoyl-L-alanine amidase family protein, partial [Clostridium butyricum]
DEGVIRTGFTNDSGKYIDITHDANIYALVKSSTTSDKLKTVKLSEYDKDNGGVTAKFLGTEAITQDNDYIYAITTVQLTYENGYAPAGVENNVSVQKFLQKIAKAQGDKEDGGYLPKSTTSYQLDAKALYDDGDVEEASKVILNDSSLDHKIVNYEVKNSTLYATGVKSGNVKVWAIKLKKGKIDTKQGTKDVDTYVAIKDDDFDQDVVGSDLADSEKAYSIDKDGNTWVLDKGKVYKSNGSDFKEMYTCDRALDRLDVYDENNLMIWEADGDVYTNVAEGKKQTDEDAGVTDEDKNPTTPTVGWNQNANGTWSFYDATGAQMKASWVNLGGTWYYLKADGVMATGWLLEGGNWYFLNPVSNGYLGAMKTGWIQDNGTWYYLNASGAMKTGWFQDYDGRWYFLKSNGAMAANEYIDGYYLGSNGAWVR